MIDLDRASDVELLRAVAKVQDAEIRRLHAVISRLAAAQGKDSEEQLAMLQQQLSDRYSKTYQNGSERRPRDNSDDDTKKKRRKKGHGPKSQPELPVKDEVHSLDPADQICPKCGEDLQERREQFVDSEEVDVVDIQYVLKRHLRKQYRCCRCHHEETALGPVKLIDGGRYSLDFAIHVAIAKYADSLPLERQVKRMRRAGLDVSSQTLWDQTWALCSLLEGAVERIHERLLSHPVVIADETRWPLLGAHGRKGTKNWFVWALVGESGVVYRIQKTRSAEDGRKLLRDYEGVVVVDGYVVYDSLAKEGNFAVAHDWCHARRKFLEAEPTSDDATAFLDDIGALFLIERELKKKTANMEPVAADELRAQVRDERSREIVDRLGRRAAEVKAMKDSPIAGAVKYLANQWKGLIAFLDDPRIPITSNEVERRLRVPVLGRVNFLGSRSERGIRAAEVFYTLIESAKINGLDPGGYLRTAASAALRGEAVPLPHEIV